MTAAALGFAVGFCIAVVVSLAAAAHDAIHDRARLDALRRKVDVLEGRNQQQAATIRDMQAEREQAAACLGSVSAVALHAMSGMHGIEESRTIRVWVN